MTFWYSKNPTAGTGHTATYSPGGNIYPSIQFWAFSGADLTAPFDQENTNGTASSVTTLSPGSITPTENDELVICNIGLSGTSGTPTDDASLLGKIGTTFTTSVAEGGFSAYIIQTTAAAINPAWTWTTGRGSASNIASFKIAAVAGTRPQGPFSHPFSGPFSGPIG
jgi:hypothetical protein